MGRWNLEPFIPRMEWVKCVVCRVGVLVDKTLPKGMVLNKDSLFICPSCVVRTNPLIYKKHADKQKFEEERRAEQRAKALIYG